jgi:hypothetical protein
MGYISCFVNADNVNLLGGNINATKNYTGALVDASKKIGLEVNAEGSRYMLLSRRRNAGQSHSMKIA